MRWNGPDGSALHACSKTTIIRTPEVLGLALFWAIDVVLFNGFFDERGEKNGVLKRKIVSNDLFFGSV